MMPSEPPSPADPSAGRAAEVALEENKADPLSASTKDSEDKTESPDPALDSPAAPSAFVRIRRTVVSVLRGALSPSDFSEKILPDDRDAARRAFVFRRLIIWQAVFIGILLAVIVFGAPFFRPILVYRALTTDNRVIPLVALDGSNQTDMAILGWAATSVTEVLTVGFGDFDRQMLHQKSRFTPDGWGSFRDAVVQQKFRQTFKDFQLVLTTVPSDMPLITSKGEDPETQTYRWNVEVPVVMTYVTNNNVSRQARGLVKLVIVRIPPHENVEGIAIQKWSM